MKLYIGNTYMGRLEDEYPKAMIMSVKKFPIWKMTNGIGVKIQLGEWVK